MTDERDEILRLIYTYWDQQSVPFYLAQVLCGESTIEETLDDLRSFERRKNVNQS